MFSPPSMAASPSVSWTRWLASWPWSGIHSGPGRCSGRRLRFRTVSLRWGNSLATFLMRVLYRASFTDMGPFRAIRRDHLIAFRMEDLTFGWNVEMQAKAIIAGSRIVETPVRYRKRIGNSKITGTVRGTVLAGTKIIGTIFKYYPGYVKSRRSEK